MRTLLKVLVGATTLAVFVACSSSDTNSSSGSSSSGGSSTSSSGGSTSSSGSTPKTDEQFKQEVTNAMHASILADIKNLVKAAEDLQAAAPTPTGRGWDRAQDAAQITAMKEAWGRAREAYEHIEGAIAPIFPDTDAAIDERYDGFLETLGAAGDQNLFDDQGVTGMHAIERILWSNEIPGNVVTFEGSLPGYKAAAIPATDVEAMTFKTKLAAKFVADVKALETQWTPAKIDIASAYQGLIDLMNEQLEKVNNASEGAEESRYGQKTMKDIRYNLDGTTKIYKVFQPWLMSKQGGGDLDAKINTGFGRLSTLYTAVNGDAIPTPPATWSAENPSAADLQTPFGKLYTGVKAEGDPKADGSTVKAMQDAGSLLGFPKP